MFLAFSNRKNVKETTVRKKTHALVNNSKESISESRIMEFS